MASTTAISWAVLAIGLKYALQYFSSGTIVWTRMAIAFAVLCGFFIWRDPRAFKILASSTVAGPSRRCVYRL